MAFSFFFNIVLMINNLKYKVVVVLLWGLGNFITGAAQKPSWNSGYYSSGTALKFTESHNKLLPTTDSVGNVFMAFHYTDTLILDGKIYRASGKNSFVIRKVDKYGKFQFNLFAQARSGGRKVVLSDLFALRDGGFALAVSYRRYAWYRKNSVRGSKQKCRRKLCTSIQCRWILAL